MTKTLQQLIEAGRFNYVSSDITLDNFPPEPVSSSPTKLFHFGENISSDKATIRIEKEGYRPANAYELLAFAEKDWNEEFVVALGSVAEISRVRRVLYLARDGARRDLRLAWRGVGWGEVCRFLAVKKDKTTLQQGCVRCPFTTSSFCPMGCTCPCHLTKEAHTEVQLKEILSRIDELKRFVEQKIKINEK